MPPTPQSHVRTAGQRRRRYTVAALATLAMAAAPLASAVGPAAAASAAKHPSLAYLKAHAKYDHVGWEPEPAQGHHRARDSARSRCCPASLSQRAASPLMSAAASSEVLGLDVSSGQGDVNWSTVKADGAKFAYVKATEGSYYINPDFAQQYNGSYGVGLIRGAYEFANPSYSGGATQADYFVAHGGGWSADGKTLPGVARHRVQPVRRGVLRPQPVVDGVVDQGLRQRIPRQDRPLGRDLQHHRLVDHLHRQQQRLRLRGPALAGRFREQPRGALPAGWGFYTIWQYADSGTFPGDQDVFNGSVGPARRPWPRTPDPVRRCLGQPARQLTRAGCSPRPPRRSCTRRSRWPGTR